MAKDFLDIVVMVPLEEEHDVLMTVFDFKGDLSDGQHVVLEYESPSPEIRIASILMSGMGKNLAREKAEYILSRFDVGVFLVFGIAGSLNNDNSIGDVCYGGELIDVNNNLSASDGKSGNPNIGFSPDHYSSDDDLVSSAVFLRNHPPTKHLFVQWQESCQDNTNNLIKQFGLPDEDAAEINIIVDARATGPIICGPVVKGEFYKDLLKKIDRQVLAVEMETAGVFEALKAHPPSNNVFMVRGICDHADGNKNELEEKTKGLARKCAAHNAASFIFWQLHSEAFISTIKKFKNRTLPLDLAGGHDVGSADYLKGFLERIRIEINERLRELSPEYRHKGSGYTLPTPRFSKISLSALEAKATTETGEEITKILSSNDCIWIKLKSSYPDDSLPWVIGQHLLGVEADGHITLPIVIDGGQLAPPNGTLSNLISLYDIDTLVALHGCMPVIVIAEPNINTANRRKYLAQEISSCPNAKVILVSREHSNLFSEDSAVKKVGAQLYSVDRVSFFELTNFLRKSFEMEPQTAEVIANRLNNAFSRFDLDAHPTYFAGIPETTLTAFLQANRRSELIQLAVDGYLTFMVAGDADDVALSRTTRQIFLQKLVYDLRVELETISKTDLVKRAEDFAEKMDYPIDSTRFVESFFSFGCLGENDGKVEFILPFMESYLLAVELSESPGSEVQYFDFDNNFLDFGTFDLYCELAANSNLIAEISERLQQSSADIHGLYSGEHIMLTHDLDSIGLSWPEHVSRTEREINAAMKIIEAGGSNAEKKQAVLDLISEASKHGEHATEIESEDDQSNDDSGEVKAIAAFNIMVGCAAVGAGAERLDAETKQDLIANILKLASQIVDGWTRDRSADSTKISSEVILNDPEFAEFRKGLETEEERKNFDRFVNHITEIIQIGMLREATGYVFYLFSEYGRQKVLSKSVEAAEVENGIEEILKGCWVADLNTQKGIRILNSSIKRLNPGVFFRMMLSDHLLARVHWDHWKEKDRIALLNLADEILKPTTIKLQKSEIQREAKLSAPQRSSRGRKKRQSRKK